MTAQTFNINDRAVQNAVRAAAPKTSTGTLTTFELYVIASDVADVVQCAGGWLCDRSMAGWRVILLTPNFSANERDIRPLQILGVSALPFEPRFQSIASGLQVDALAVAADVLSSDERVREHVVRTLERGRAEVTFWGERPPVDLGRRVGNVAHRLSAAARAFKAHALVAAAVSADSVGPTEAFLSGVRWCPSDGSDLIPTG